MKRFLLPLLILSVATPALAQLSGSGFYRVVNVADSRYVYVTDNTGSASATSPDLKAVQLIKGLDNAISNPASVLYFNHISGTQYDIQAQGTSVNQIIGHTPNVYYSERSNAYQVYANNSGATIYLGSDNGEYYQNKRVSYLSINSSGNYNLWNIYPISTDGSNYFGIAPTVSLDGKYYQSFYADFAFSFASSGMKAYYISSTSGDEATLVEITSSIIPARTPVIIECSSSSASDNRLNLFSSGGTSVSGNILKGVFFSNPYRAYSTAAVTKYDKTTMSLRGRTSNGKLGFVVCSDKNLPANQAYLVVASAAGSEIEAKLGSASSIDNITIEDKDQTGIFSILGTRFDCSFEELPAGIYIVNGKKVIKH